MSTLEPKFIFSQTSQKFIHSIKFLNTSIRCSVDFLFHSIKIISKNARGELKVIFFAVRWEKIMSFWNQLARGTRNSSYFLWFSFQCFQPCLPSDFVISQIHFYSKIFIKIPRWHWNLFFLSSSNHFVRLGLVSFS